MNVHHPKLYNMAHLSLNVFTASKGSNSYILIILYFTHMHTLYKRVKEPFSLVSSLIPFHSKESSKCHTGFCNFGSAVTSSSMSTDLEIASQVGEFINNFHFCSFTVTVG